MGRRKKTTLVKDATVIAAFVTGMFTLLTTGLTYFGGKENESAMQQQSSVQAYVLSERAYYDAEKANCAAIIDYLKDDTPNRLLTQDQNQKMIEALGVGLKSCQVRTPSNQSLLEGPKASSKDWIGGGGTSNGGGAGSDY